MCTPGRMIDMLGANSGESLDLSQYDDDDDDDDDDDEARKIHLQSLLFLVVSVSDTQDMLYVLEVYVSPVV